MSKRPWFPLYTADFDRKTKHLSPEAVGCYIRLMNFYWDNNGGIDLNPAGLCRVMGLERRRWTQIWRELDTFFVTESTDVGYTIWLPRLEEELKKTIAISKAKAESGKRGGQASAKMKSQQKSTHSHSHTHTHKKKEQGTRKKRASQLPADFVLPEDYRAYCKTKRPELNPDVVAENFKDYYLSHGKPMVDWKRTWQRWVRNERPPKNDRGFEVPVKKEHISQTYQQFDPTANTEQHLDTTDPYADLKG